MKIRIMSTREETACFVEFLKTVCDVREVSGFVPNRGDSKLGRVYVDAEVVVQEGGRRG